MSNEITPNENFFLYYGKKDNEKIKNMLSLASEIGYQTPSRAGIENVSEDIIKGKYFGFLLFSNASIAYKDKGWKSKGSGFTKRSIKEVYDFLLEVKNGKDKREKEEEEERQKIIAENKARDRKNFILYMAREFYIRNYPSIDVGTSQEQATIFYDQMNEAGYFDK